MASVTTSGSRALVRSGPGTDFPVVGSRSNGDNLDIIESRDGWARIGTDQWISENLLSETPVAGSNYDVIPHPARRQSRHWKLLVNFATNSAELRPKHKIWLRGFAAVEARNHEFVWIRGFTSNLGGEVANQPLSERRARAVSDFLTRDCGIPSDRITGVSGVASRWARGSATDDSGRSRGVEVVITHVIQFPLVEIEGEVPDSPTSTKFFIKFFGGFGGGAILNVDVAYFIIRNPDNYWQKYKYLGAARGFGIPVSISDGIPGGNAGWVEFTTSTPYHVGHFVGMARLDQAGIQRDELGFSWLELHIPDVARVISLPTGSGLAGGVSEGTGRFMKVGSQQHDTGWDTYD